MSLLPAGAPLKNVVGGPNLAKVEAMIDLR
jgi:hypothetical protein